MNDYFNANMDLMAPRRARSFSWATIPSTPRSATTCPPNTVWANATNSLIANGCVIEGEVGKLRPLPRRARRQKRQGQKLLRHHAGHRHRSGCNLKYVITDKDVVIKDERTLMGFATYPVCSISKASCRLNGPSCKPYLGQAHAAGGRSSARNLINPANCGSAGGVFMPLVPVGFQRITKGGFPIEVFVLHERGAPFAASGGLADVSGSLPQALRQRLIGCRIVMPLYEEVPEEFRENMKFVTSLSVPVSWRPGSTAASLRPVTAA